MLNRNDDFFRDDWNQTSGFPIFVERQLQFQQHKLDFKSLDHGRGIWKPVIPQRGVRFLGFCCCRNRRSWQMLIFGARKQGKFLLQPSAYFNPGEILMVPVEADGGSRGKNYKRRFIGWEEAVRGCQGNRQTVSLCDLYLISKNELLQEQRAGLWWRRRGQTRGASD